MPLKAPVITMTATTLALGDTSIADTNLQVVTQGQLQEMVN